MINQSGCGKQYAGCRPVILIFACAYFLLFHDYSIAIAEEPVNIKSEKIEYDAKAFTYTASGQVKIQRGMITIEADVIRYNEKTSDVSANGNVRFEDPEFSIKAKTAELNLEAKTGKLFEAVIFSKKDNYHITGREIEKKGEKEYAIDRAAFTTCDAPIPEWCFKGKDLDIITGDRIKARDVTFNIKNSPVLYSPYFSTSINNERKTGFLMPGAGYVKSKGIHYEQSFFWAIAENRDATFLYDIYAKSGMGQGVEYRHLETDGSRGNFRIYHLKDKSLAKDFWDLRGVYENREAGRNLSGYLNLNYINSRDYYNEYNPYIISKDMGFLNPAAYLNRTTERFLESTAEASLRLEGSRLYLAAQHLIDLKAGTDASAIAQRLPEMGYVVNPYSIGPVIFSMNSAVASFLKEGSSPDQRLDIYARVMYSFGEDIVITQGVGLRETAYSLRKPDDFGSSPHREGLDYNIAANMRLVKKYNKFIHIAEPSMAYAFISSSNANLPFFDSAELYSRTSKAELSVLNRFMDSNGEFLTLRVSQTLDFQSGDRHFLPVKLEAALKGPVGFRGDMSYDVNTGKTERVNSDITIGTPDAVFSIGERYSRADDILFYSLGVNYHPSKAISAEGSLWYDARSRGFTDIMAKFKYKQQCWAATLAFTKKPGDYSISVLFDLLGIGTLKI